MTSLRSRSTVGPYLVVGICAALSIGLVFTRRPSETPRPASVPIGVPAPSQEEARPSLLGQVSVIDGDTLDLQGTRLRLFGIDAPESSQSCRLQGALFPIGRRSAQALDAFIGQRPIRCEILEKDLYGRSIAKCFVGNESLNAWQVSNGWAFAFRRYSEAFSAEEFTAAGFRVGVWACDSLERPWDYRAAKRSALSAGVTQSN